MRMGLFRSPLASRLQAFTEAGWPRNRGGSSRQKILIYLDRFLMRSLKPGQTITRPIAESWMKSMEHLSPNTRINRLCVLRQFCRYLSYFDPRTCCLHQSCLPRRTRPAPHIYSRRDLRRIMAAARRLGPRGSLRPAVISHLVGLLYATGLRVGEALNLRLKDMDLKRRVIEVREGKFKKSRYVPITRATAGHLAVYLRHRRRAGFPADPSAHVFVSLSGNKHGHPSFVSVFLEILRQLGLRGPKGQPGPRVHDLRHTFAVHRLLAWYRQGANLAAKLPLLSTYLGHSTITGTEIYLQATAQLLECASQRFHNRCAVPLRPKAKRHDKA